MPDKFIFADKIIKIDNSDLKFRFLREFNNILYDKRGYYLTIYQRYLEKQRTISSILESKNLNSDFIFLAIVESGLNNFAQSSNKAAGTWQFIPLTAKYYGLIVNSSLDERFDLKLSTESASNFILDLISCKEFENDILLSIASFNAGANSVLQAMHKQNSNEFKDLVLAPETEKYPIKVILLSEIFKHPQKYGFSKEYQTFKDKKNWTILTYENKDHCLNYNELCKELNISFRNFKSNNPHLKYNYYRKSSFLNSYAKIWLKIPRQKIIEAKKYLQHYGSCDYKESNDLISLFNIQESKLNKNYFNKNTRVGDLGFFSNKNWRKVAFENSLKFKRVKSGIKIPIIENINKIN